jgi:hypothetical protein
MERVKKMSQEVDEIVEAVEAEKGVTFERDEILFAVIQARVKMILNEKESDYFPLIFRTELEDTAMRSEINRILLYRTNISQEA